MGSGTVAAPAASNGRTKEGKLNMKRTLIAGAAAMVAMLAIASSASAAKPPATVIGVDCGSHGTFNVLDWGNGGNNRFKPAHMDGTNQVVIPVEFFDVVTVFSPDAGDPQTFPSPDDERHAPANVDLLTCTFYASVSVPGGTYTTTGGVRAYVAGP
jgi:hypothetical protein